MEKEKVQKIQILEYVLKEGIAIVNNEENKIKGIDLNVIFSSSLMSLSANECFKRVEKLFESLELSDIVSLILSHSKRGLLKMQYFDKVILLSERGILNSSKQVQVEEINNYSKTFLKLFQPKVREIITDIEMEPIMPIIEGLYWDFIVSLDNINELNDMIKCHIRNEYYDMTNDYLDSILQRKISLNSKRLAIMNYIKQIQNETAIFYPYEIKYKIHAENYIGRKCDQSYYLKSKKRN